MGDRGNIVIHNGTDPEIYIYAHWHGSQLAELLAGALETPQAQARIGDPAYLARIVLCQIMQMTGEIDTETGWGLSTVITDGADRVVHLDAQTGDVWFDGHPSFTCQAFIDHYSTTPGILGATP